MKDEGFCRFKSWNEASMAAQRKTTRPPGDLAARAGASCRAAASGSLSREATTIESNETGSCGCALAKTLSVAGGVPTSAGTAGEPEPSQNIRCSSDSTTAKVWKAGI